MKIRLKLDRLWLDVERESMKKLLQKYKTWEAQTLERVRQTKDLHTLREFFYELGERWEWDQVTGEWLSEGEPLDAVSFVLRLPGLDPKKERYVIYAVMAYSKGFTDQFDHLGDKERIVIERDLETGKMVAWSTTGHGAVDIFPTDLSDFADLDEIVRACHLTAQPGDHALRLCLPIEKERHWTLYQRLWTIASGTTSFTWRHIDMVGPDDIENGLGFKFYRYAKAVIELERAWQRLTAGTVERARELLLDRVPPHIEEKNKRFLRQVEGLLHILWFRPPIKQLIPAQALYKETRNEPTPTKVQEELLPYLGELVFSLNDVIEKTKYLKWKSVVERKGYAESSIFDNLGISGLAREALVVALDDILKEHTLAYVAYPEKATMMGKAMRILFGLFVLPVRLVSAFRAVVATSVRGLLERFVPRKERGSDNGKAEMNDMVEPAD